MGQSEDKEEHLLIIGNGFDLHCGINSSFRSFLSRNVKPRAQDPEYKNIDAALRDLSKQCLDLSKSIDEYVCSSDKRESKKVNVFFSFNNVMSIIDIIKAQFDIPILTVWDMICWVFSGKYGFNKVELETKNWADVEALVEGFLTDTISYGENSSKENNNTGITATLRLLRRYFNLTNTSKIRDTQFVDLLDQNYPILTSQVDVPPVPFKDIRATMIVFIIVYIFDFNLSERSFGEDYKDYFLNWLRGKLTIFESSLADYLWGETHKDQMPNSSEHPANIRRIALDGKTGIDYHYDSSYEKNARLTIEQLYPKHSIKLHVLSFNYTTPTALFPDLVVGPNELGDISVIGGRHVHGSIDNKFGVIIGIDQSVISSSSHVDSSLLRFTKTYRTMTFSTSSEIHNFLDKLAESRDDNYHANITKMNLDTHDMRMSVIDKNIKYLDFFGQSFSPADYSYFQAIFDFYSIYDSSVQVVFHWAPHDDGTPNYKQNQEELYFDSIMKLLSDYGDSLDNKAHGQNILHKMNLEGRIRIHRIPENFPKQNYKELES